MRLRTTEAIKRAEIPRSSFRTVDTLLEATNRRLAALTEAEARQLWPVIEDALRGVTGRLADPGSRPPPSGVWAEYDAARSRAGKFTDHDARVMRLQLLRTRQALAERIGTQLAKSDTKAQFAAIADMRHEVAALSQHFGKPRQLDIDTVLTVTDTSNLLVERIAKAAAKRSRETIQATASTLGQAVAEGLSFRDTGKLLESRFGVEAYKAERLARTELVHAHNLQRFEVADAEGYGLLWNAATYRACSICRALDEQYAPHGKSFPGGVMHAPAHPNCFPAGTPVAGRFVAGLQAMYAGEMIEVRTASGKRLALTANHPVLTTGGMVAANRLRDGMYALGDSMRVGDAAPLHGVNKDDGPARIDDVLGSLRSERTSRRESCAAGDLHGDAACVDGDIHIVGTDRKLPVHAVADELQGLADLVLQVAAMQQALVSGLGSGQLGVEGVALAASCHLSGGHLSHSASRVHAEPLQPLSVGAPAYFDASGYEGVVEGGTADTGLFGKLLQRGAGAVAVDQIVEVRDYQFRGQVYDLQSTTGWMIASGIITSNCRCSCVLWRPEWKE